ncbi:MAG: hypothetical protein N3G20_00415, partial [Verrucomicrobiae bacterium]|nr:hypothetical protein [Verrucomicrobiae bacterium]
VGSEMCIRDSGNGVRSAFGLNGPWLLIMLGASNWPEGLAMGAFRAAICGLFVGLFDYVGTGQTNIPSWVDLRPEFDRFALKARQQEDRPTCSVFTVVGAIEFALAKCEGVTPRLSVEFLNWAANNVRGDNNDGAFFSDLWKGFEVYGICSEDQMPYCTSFDVTRSPSATALADAKARLRSGLRLHWIKEWDVNTGLTPDQFMTIKRILGRGWPVCAGLRWPKQERWIDGVLQMCGPDGVRDGHSVLFVGYRDDSRQPGGGVFIFRNTAGEGRDAMMPYDYARAYVNDAAWIDCETDGSNRGL